MARTGHGRPERRPAHRRERAAPPRGPRAARLAAAAVPCDGRASWRSSWWWKTLRAFRFRCWCSAASTTASRRSCPAARRTTLMVIVGVLCGVVLVQAISRMFFLRRSGRIGQKVLLELRRRVFRHFQRLGHRVPRPIHVGPGGEPVHQRRRGHPGHAGDRLRQPDHRRAHADRHGHSACRHWMFGSA